MRVTEKRKSPAGKGTAHPSPEEIGRRAYELYQARGCQDGCDLEDWLRAERELLTRSNRLRYGKDDKAK